MALPAADPATFYYRRLSPGRLFLIENTDLPWSVALTRKIAKRKRIPAANIFSFALGTDPSVPYDAGSNQNLWDNILEPINTAVVAAGGQGVFLGPGCPTLTVMRGQWVLSGSPPYLVPAATGDVLLSTLVASTQQIAAYIAVDGITTLEWVEVSGQPDQAYVRYLADTQGLYVYHGSYNYALTGVNTPDTVGGMGDQYFAAGTSLVVLPTQLAIDLLGDSGNYCLLHGKFGVSYSPGAYTTEPIPTEMQETAFTAGRIVDKALRYSAGQNPADRYQQPVHFQFAGYTPTYPGICEFAQKAAGWGYDVTYFWRNAGNANTETYTPVSGSAYTLEELQAGQVKDWPYHVMIGDASNAEMVFPPFDRAWRPTAGGASCMGPSEGWIYAIQGLSRGAAGGASNGLHITTSIYYAATNLAHNLFRGMSWAEAIYYSGYQSNGAIYAVGDPLLTPFPRGDV